MLKINNKLCQKGFSLIELMVAVVILALAIFGIFQAYSVGFMGMADARDRTEAVNYIQKTLEEYKNTTFVKIIDKPMHQITGTKFLSGSIVIEQETRLKKIITQVRWPDRNGDIKIEEASTLIYATEKTGELLDASEIVLYASPYFRILPNTSTDLFAEIQDANGNIVTNKVYTVNFFILEGDTLGYLDSATDDTNKGIASVKFYSNEDSDGTVSIKASADLDGDGTDDVSDTIVITISTGAEGIILKTEPESGLSPVENPIVFNLYVVDASFTDDPANEPEHVKEYTGTITLSATGPGTLSENTVTPTEGKASFILYSNGTPGTVEIIASAPDLDLGYAEVAFTGGAESIQLTPINGSIYEGESIEITIKILDENLNQTPFTGYISITSDSGDSFDPESPIEFDNQSFRTVDFSSSNVGTVIITASGTDFENDVSINLEVLKSLNPSYIELSAIPSNVEANGEDYSFITATVYDDNDPAEVVTNYTTPITFEVSEGEGYFLDGETKVWMQNVTPSHGQAYIDVYSDSSGTTTVTATSGTLTETVNITFYSSASYILLTTNSDSVVANGEDYAVITATVLDDDDNTVTNYLYDIVFSVTGFGYFDGENTVTPTDGTAQINLYSNEDSTATVTAESYDESQRKYLNLQPVTGIDIDFTQPAEKNITFVEGSVERFDKARIIKFDIKVTGADFDLSSMVISWSAAATLDKIEIMSPSSSGTYEPTKETNGVSSPYTYENIDTTLFYAEPGLSTIRLTFLSDNNVMKHKTIYVTFYDNENNYPITVYIP